MKRSLVALLIGLAMILSPQGLLAGEPPAIIISPTNNALLPSRVNIPVSVTIQNYQQDTAANAHYWVSFANVDRKGTKMQHWPKFYVKSDSYTGLAHDGSINPLPTPQPMVILLLKVDDATNQRFTEWMLDGPTRGYPGLNINPRQIVAEQPIRLP